MYKQHILQHHRHQVKDIILNKSYKVLSLCNLAKNMLPKLPKDLYDRLYQCQTKIKLLQDLSCEFYKIKIEIDKLYNDYTFYLSEASGDSFNIINQIRAYLIVISDYIFMLIPKNYSS